MDEQIISSLVGHLKKGTCILVLGPEFINIDLEDKPFAGSILNYLAECKFKKYKKPTNYLTEDGFFFFDEKNNNDQLIKENILREAAQYYRDLPVTESYETLAQIPFNAIISLSPDKLIDTACRNIGKEPLYRKYTPEEFQDEPTIDSKQSPLIYNLFGDIEDEDVLLFTFDNLFAFLDKLFQNAIFPNFQRRLCKARSFIFLGFTYDKWYLKLIFYLIKKMRMAAQQIESKYAVIDMARDSVDQRIDFFKSHFGMIFSSENEKSFINDLYTACADQGMLFKDQVAKGEDVDEEEGPPRYRILYLASSPKDLKALDQGPEYFDSIKSKLRGHFYLPMEPVFKVSADTLRKSILGEDGKEPQLVFISCHGGHDNTLLLCGEDGQSAPLSLDDLVEIVSLLATKNRRLECVVFSSCQSAAQAKAISTIIPYAIGMREPILEDASNIFTEGFFEGFLRKRSDLPFAFRNGILKLKACPLDGITYQDLPLLYHKGELDPPNLHTKAIGV